MNHCYADQGMHAHLLSMHFSKQEATILHRAAQWLLSGKCKAQQITTVVSKNQAAAPVVQVDSVVHLLLRHLHAFGDFLWAGRHLTHLAMV